MNTDEDIMIKKLEEHRNVIDMIVLIGEKENLDIERTTGNDTSGDFSYPEENHNQVVNAIDEYLGGYKWDPTSTAK